jgi:serine/threonine protein kinase
MNYGRYQIFDELGKGSMGVVYSAHDPQIDRLVAVKVLRQDKVTSEDFVRRFLLEAKAIGRLSHPNIVTVYDAGQDHDTIFIAMELLKGKPLSEFSENRGLRFQEIVNIGVQVAEALDYAHSQGIFHRDIKPPNIILTSGGQPKITDFGIAHIEDPNAPGHTQVGDILGTPFYMSPEQVAGQPVDGRSDLFSLGVILYELYTGKRPFTGSNISSIFNAIMQDSPAKPAETDSSVSPILSSIIMISLNKAPEKRYQTGIEMANALKSCLQRRKSDECSLPGPAKKKKTRRMLVAALVLLVCLLGAAVFILKTWRGANVNSSADLKAVLALKSEPNGARIFLDGSFRGNTPQRIDLPLGQYEVRLSLEGYYEWEGRLNLKEEGEIPLSVRLEREEGSNQ